MTGLLIALTTGGTPACAATIYGRQSQTAANCPAHLGQFPGVGK
jgi:hypothetical protein